MIDENKIIKKLDEFRCGCMDPYSLGSCPHNGLIYRIKDAIKKVIKDDLASST